MNTVSVTQLYKCIKKKVYFFKIFNIIYMCIFDMTHICLADKLFFLPYRWLLKYYYTTNKLLTLDKHLNWWNLNLVHVTAAGVRQMKKVGGKLTEANR